MKPEEEARVIKHAHEEKRRLDGREERFNK
jgi:hypothetical protein